MTGPVEVAWFAPLCDDDYEHLGVANPDLRSSWSHCRRIAVTADEVGYDNLLMPSGYALGIDNTTFAAGIASHTSRIRLLLALRLGELWPPQLARQMATLDEMLDGRLTINIISSDLPGQTLESAARYRRTLEYMEALRTLLSGEHLELRGEFLDVDLDPPRIAEERRRCPPFYFGGFSDHAKNVAAAASDVFLTWPDTVAEVEATVGDLRRRAKSYNRNLKFGLRAHVIVRESESEARAAAQRLVSRLDDDTGAAIRARSLDATSRGVRRQAELREQADAEGYAEPHLWTGVGRARSGAGAAIVGDPDQVRAKIQAYRDVGMDAFILSGYPHLEECRRFASHVLHDLDHGPLEL